MLLLGFIVAATFWPGLANAANGSRWATLYVAVPTALFFVRIVPNSVYVVLGLLLVWAEFSQLWTPVHADGINALFQFGVIACAFLVAHNTEDLRPLYSGLGLGLWISSGIAIAQTFGYYPVAVVNNGGPASGLFVNPDVFGEISIAVLVGLIADRTWWIAAVVVPSIILSECRSAILGGVGDGEPQYCFPPSPLRFLFARPTNGLRIPV